MDLMAGQGCTTREQKRFRRIPVSVSLLPLTTATCNLLGMDSYRCANSWVTFVCCFLSLSHDGCRWRSTWDQFGLHDFAGFHFLVLSLQGRVFLFCLPWYISISFTCTYSLMLRKPSRGAEPASERQFSSRLDLLNFKWTARQWMHRAFLL